MGRYFIVYCDSAAVTELVLLVTEQTPEEEENMSLADLVLIMFTTAMKHVG